MSNIEENYLTIEGLAERWNCHPDTVRRRIAKGQIPAYKLPGTNLVRIKESDIEPRRIPTAGGAR